MKPDIKDAIEKAGLAVAGTTASWSFAEINQWVSFAVGVVTFIFIVVQTIYLLRKWRMLEKNNWRHISSSIAPLDDKHDVEK